MVKEFNILDVKISVTNPKIACEFIDKSICLNRKCYVCIVPVSTIVESKDNLEYRKVINNASMATPDGMPVVWIGKAKGFKEIERTYGPDLLIRLCDIGQSKGYSHFFYGGSDKSNKALISSLKRKFPSIKIAGYYSPGFIAVHQQEKEEVLKKIDESGANILWVGLGSPKQDFWMSEHINKLNIPVMIGVGAAFDFISGVKKQAPLWMRNIGLEWLFRLVNEPKRLWRRYLIGNIKFIFMLLSEFFRNIISRGKR